MSFIRLFLHANSLLDLSGYYRMASLRYDQIAFAEASRACMGAWPETREKLSHGSPTWWGGRKTFVTFDDHHGGGRVAVWVKTTFIEQALRAEADPETYFVPPYLGPSGWIGMRLDRDPDWTTVTQLLEEGYRMVAPKRAIADLDRAINSGP